MERYCVFAGVLCPSTLSEEDTKLLFLTISSTEGVTDCLIVRWITFVNTYLLDLTDPR